MNHELLQALDQGACAVTATSRLRYELKAAYDGHKLAQGCQVWPTPEIHTWESWIAQLWSNSERGLSQLCLSAPQLRQLLSDIIEHDLKSGHSSAEPGLAALWNIPSTAKSALDAWQLCHQWRISYRALRAETQPDHAGFGRWATQLYARLERNHWISAAQIPDLLIESGYHPSQTTVLLGFDHLNTQQHELLQHFRNSGVKLSELKSDSSLARQLRRYEFDSVRAEWRHIGAWARDKLLDDPASRIAIITPDIHGIEQLATDALREQLTPQFFQHDIPDPFHFSRGAPLSRQPLPRSALTCLELLGDIHYRRLDAILLSPYWGNEAEQGFRAQLAIDLRRELAYHFDLFELIFVLSRSLRKTQNPSTSAELTLNKLNALQSIKSDTRGTRPISQWRDTFTAGLHALGWPGNGLSSADFQAYQAWEQVMEDWGRLDAVSQPISLSAALNSLKSLCRDTLFQPRGSTAPVQIMGILEASGQNFDAVWLAGFDEQAWPVSSSAHPFIPIHMQKKAGIPEATPELQADLANRRTLQLCSLHYQVNFSHACVQGDVRLGPSLIMPAISCSEAATLRETFSLENSIRSATPPLQTCTDDIGLPYLEPNASGGTSLVQKQSACPFSAYAHYRLKASEEDEPEIGLDNLRRGGLLHRILESIWGQLENSRELHALIQSNKLEPFLEEHISDKLGKEIRTSGLGQGFDMAEKARLKALLTQWLTLEYQRPAFAVQAVEKKLEYRINDLRLHFRLDRIDRLEYPPSNATDPPALFIIDYKSGRCSLKDWAQARPEQPQIPLYYLALTEGATDIRVEALGFAQVSADACEFVGITRRADTLPALKSLDQLAANTSLKQDFANWEELKPKWKRRIGRLVDDFKRGVAHVDPKSAGSCQYCDFGPLCRIHTRALDREYDAD